MRAALVSIAFAALAAAAPQAVTSAIAPSSSPPAGCVSTYPGSFEISIENVTSSSKRDLQKKNTVLVMTLNGGILKDEQSRTGYIASNQQFQFDAPPQAGAIYTAGWSVCGNGSLAIGGSAVFYECLSGTFYNLYEENTAAQCNEVTIQVVNDASAPASATGVATQQPDGQPTASPVTSVLCQFTDGQPQATGCVTQISDAQPQAPTGVVSQISDAQPQAPTSTAVVSQISDAQPQAPTSTGAVVSQISDAQPQAPTSAPVVTQISDAQPQAPTSTAAVVSQISDAQPQAPTASASIIPSTGGASQVKGEFFGLAAGLLAVAML